MYITFRHNDLNQIILCRNLNSKVSQYSHSVLFQHLFGVYGTIYEVPFPKHSSNNDLQENEVHNENINENNEKSYFSNLLSVDFDQYRRRNYCYFSVCIKLQI